MSEEESQSIFSEKKICVIIPTFNNEQTLGEVLGSILPFTSNIMVINDGSTDSTSNILGNYKTIKTFGYKENKGKGFALRFGFNEAVRLGYEYAITIDSDGQHFAEDLPKFVNTLTENGSCLIIGARNMEQSSVPGKSSFGNKFSNFWFWAETGISLPDTQSGYRLYPIRLMNSMHFFTNKFEFEIESIVRIAWKGIKVLTVPVKVYYAPVATRITHFRPLQDFTRISILNTVLFTFAILIYHPLTFLKKIFSKSSYLNFLDEIRNSEHSRLMTAFSVAFGVFMGIIPIWGFQLIIAIFLSFVFKLNKALVILFANISIPPMIPFILFLSYKLGAFWMGEKATDFIFNQKITIDSIKINLTQYLIGSTLLSVIASIAFGFSTYLLLTFYKSKKRGQ